MRTSNYVIDVKLPNSNEHLLVHGYSGAVDVVKPNVAKFLEEGKRPGSRPSATLSDSVIQILAKRGYLTDKTPDQEEKYVCRLAETLHNHLKKSGSSFLIIPTYNCNLRCVYCFEKRLRTNGRDWMEKVVDRDAVDTIFRSMEDLKPLKDKSYPIILYGGEPLLAGNFEIIKYIVEKAQTGKYSLSAITNGIDLETYLPLLSPDKIKRLQITLDGPPAVHNKRRCGPCGLKSFGIIADNITKALETGIEVRVRIHVDRGNADHLEELSNLMVERGWIGKRNFQPYVYPVHDSGPRSSGAYMSVSEANERLKGIIEKNPRLNQLEEADAGLGLRLKRFFRTGDLPAFIPSHCGSNNGMYIFDPFGDVYVCWEVVGTPSGRVGTYSDEGVRFDERKLGQWMNRTVTNIPQCRKCKFLFFCGGGCAHHACNRTGDHNSPCCEKEIRKRFYKVAPEVYSQFLAERKAAS